MKKDINYYLNLPYEIKIVRLDDGDYYAQYADARLNKLVLMSGDGKTPNEAVDDLQNAFKSYLEYAIEAGREIPEPYDENKKVRVNVSLSQGLLNSIDSVSKNRSAFLEKAASMALANAF
ncbi:hypothetical protein CR66_03250 [Campylobacter mucosalis]|uniref:hypothetical protein n=1 Tax=Campylobacter mucosalis TaxID=202 RepID=UPI0004D92DF8|nr:hypothetical protein [Campylobacter mucosalis]KEA46230.1 hypothetical protein CR66_03250 [Campylobacter mucosalis]QKF62688.1 toxin-antitoxin system, antitoxin component, HicB family [Campylobacter mucosalis]